MIRGSVVAGVSLLFLPHLLGSCASGGSAPGEGGGRPPWPEGTFDLVATVTYRSDDELSTRTERIEHRAELVIGPGETFQFTSSSGLCQTPTPDEVQRDRSRGLKSFHCRDARFALRPLAGTVGGSAHVTVQEGIRKRGRCQQWEDTPSGGRQCVAYTWYVDLQARSKPASLRVMRRNPLDSSRVKPPRPGPTGLRRVETPK